MKGTTTLELPRGAGSAGIARLIVTAHGASLPSERLKSANLMVSELVVQRVPARRGPDPADRALGRPTASAPRCSDEGTAPRSSSAGRRARRAAAGGCASSSGSRTRGASKPTRLARLVHAIARPGRRL